MENKILLKKPIYKYSDLPKEVQLQLLQNEILLVLYTIFFLSTIIVMHDFYSFKVGLLFFSIFTVYIFHLNYIFLYDKVKGFEGIVKEKETTKLGSYIYIQQEDTYYKVRVKLVNRIRIGSVIRYYVMPSAVYMKDEDLYVVTGYVLHKIIKNKFENK